MGNMSQVHKEPEVIGEVLQFFGRRQSLEAQPHADTVKRYSLGLI